MGLAGHGAQAAHLPIDPLQYAVPAGGIPRQEFAGFLGQILQDRAGFEDGQAFESVNRSTIAGILLLGEIARNSALNWSPLLMFTGRTRYCSPVSSSMMVIFLPLPVGQK